MHISALIAAVMNAAASRLSPIAPKHPLPQFYGQHTNPRRNGRRQQNKALGSRQAKKARKAAQRADKTLAQFDVPAPETINAGA